MVNIARVTINWTGFTGAPGYTNLYWRNSSPGIITQAVVDNAITKTDAFITAMRQLVPLTVTLQTEAQVEELDESTGDLVAFWNGTPAAAGSGTAGGAYSAASGAVVSWSTNTVRLARRIRGRTFVVPIGGVAMDLTGSIDTSELGILRTAADALRAASGDARLVIWARPRPASDGPPATAFMPGVSAEVTSSNVADKVAVLTSRRD